MIDIYHGSSEIIKIPKYGKGKKHNDYGLGFYCTEHKELAKEWACNGVKNGIANHYRIDLSDLKILNLSLPEYSTLHWLSVLVSNRVIDFNAPIIGSGIDWLKKTYPVDIANYDIIIGYRADDSYFSFARDFLSNTISLEQLEKAMKLGALGEQIVFKSKTAIERLNFVDYETAPGNIYYPKRKYRDSEARASYRIISSILDVNGTFLSDLIRRKEKK